MKNYNLFFSKLIIIVVVTMFIQHIGYTQKFGKIDESDLDQSVHPIDSTADACYILKKAKAYFDVTTVDIFLVVEHHQRIKVYNEDGERFGSFVLPLYKNGSNQEKITGLKAVTFNRENGEIKESKLNKKDVYTEETSENWLRQKFAMPDVKSGSVIDIQYDLRTPFRFFIPRFNFQMDVPVNYAEYEVRIPSYYTYTPVPTGYVSIERSQKEVNGDYNTDVAYTFIARDVKALPPDDFVLDIEDYRSSLKYELYSSQFPNRMQEYYVKDWNEVAKDLMESEHFGKEIGKRTKELEPLIEGISEKSYDEKIHAIYSFVQGNFSWNGDYGIWKDEGVKKLLNIKSGSIGDINMLLLNLLIQAGIEAKPFLLKSRGSGLLNESFPSITELNYLLAYVPVGESYILLDASSKYIPVGQLPKRAINLNGLLIEGKTGKILHVANPNIHQTVTVGKYDIDLESPGLIGSGDRILKNIAAASYREEADNKNESKNLDESLNEGDDGEEDFLENSFKLREIQNLDDIDQDVRLSYDENIYNEIHKIGDQLFIDAAIDFGLKENPFFEERREFPVFFSSLIDTRQIITINIPDGYKVESVPDMMRISLPNKAASFHYDVRHLDNSVVINYAFKISADYILPNEYPNLKELYNRIVDKSKEKIVLSPYP